APGRSLGECRPLTNARWNRSFNSGPSDEQGTYCASSGRFEGSVGCSQNSACEPNVRRSCSSPVDALEPLSLPLLEAMKRRSFEPRLEGLSEAIRECFPVISGI